jgi:hypothetical protein
MPAKIGAHHSQGNSQYPQMLCCVNIEWMGIVPNSIGLTLRFPLPQKERPTKGYLVGLEAKLA